MTLNDIEDLQNMQLHRMQEEEKYSYAENEAKALKSDRIKIIANPKFQLTKQEEKDYSAFLDEFKLAYESATSGSLDSAIKKLKSGYFACNKSMTYLGEGSGRIVYQFNDRLCLKIAKSDLGIWQNKSDKKILLQNLPCFSFLYAVSSDSSSLLVEKVVPCEESSASIRKLSDILHVDAKTFLKDIEILFENIKNGNAKEISQLDDVVSFKQAIENPTCLSQKILRQLVEFSIKNKDVVNLFDFEYVDNWGIAQRDNEECAIILDCGFSEFVEKFYYNFQIQL